MDLFDIKRAVKFVRNRLSEPAKSEISDEDIEVIIEMIFDFYEDNGLLDLDSDVDDPTPSVMSEYICNEILSNEPGYKFISCIPEIVAAENEYEQMLF